MIIALQLHSGDGTERFFPPLVAHIVCEAECGKQLQLKYSVTQLRTLPPQSLPALTVILHLFLVRGACLSESLWPLQPH